MAFHGAIGQFDRDVDEWDSYCERFRLYATANDITAAEKLRAVFLSVCGAPTYELIRSLVAPNKPTEKTLEELTKLVKDHLTPRPSSIVQRFHFNARVQNENESVSQYVAELRKLAETCEFDASLENMLRDRLVCGLRDPKTQRRLLAESQLTFGKAFELAQAAELAEKSVKDLQGQAQNDSAQAFKLELAKRKRSQSAVCSHCGGKHQSTKCRLRDAECYSCGKPGHIAKVCRSSRVSRQRSRSPIRKPQPEEVTATEGSNKQEVYTLFHFRDKLVEPLNITVIANGIRLPMQIDTGAAVSVISEITYYRLWSTIKRPPLQNTSVQLRTYSGEKLPVRGQVQVQVSYRGQEARLRLVVVAGKGPTLMGRNWLKSLDVQWQSSVGVHHMSGSSVPSGLNAVLGRHVNLFKDELGLIKGVKATFSVDKTAIPRFFRARSVPFALRDKVEAELDRLVKAGILRPVRFSDWAAPIVPVVKKDGRIRICGDYKLTANRATFTDPYPIPRIDDLLASTARAKLFSKLDLANAYLQLELDEDSKKYVTISTHKGLFQYNRLPFGVSSAPSLFQRTMEGIVGNIQNVLVYSDDILVAGSSEEEHLHTLEVVLSRLEAAGLRLKLPKCFFMLSSVEYLGHKISAEGIHPTEEKKRAILDAPPPQNLQQLRSFLGLLNFYGKFLPNLASTLAPLYDLLKKNSHWHWGCTQSEAFSKAKQLLTSAKVLTPFDAKKKLCLSCDASPYGIGAVLSHMFADGSERPIAYASRTLAPAEKKYCQLEKEGLAVVYGVKKFHQYLFGQEFVIFSDHKPLQYLFSESRPVPPLASSRIQRWALTLSAYSYKIVFKSGKQQANADALSRLPLQTTMGDIPIPEDTVLMLQALDRSDGAVSVKHIREWTSKDPILSLVRRAVRLGDWSVVPDSPETSPFRRRDNELSLQDDCVLWGNRVVVPQAGREVVTGILHEGHPGASRMKSLARGMVWWPGMDSDLDAKVKQCQQCQANRKAPPVAPLHPWEWPTRPWSRLHVDFAGPFQGKMFIILVDAHSKWLEVGITPSTSSTNAISFLRSTFATHGLPELLVSDNGSAFTSQEFKTFVSRNGFRHTRCAAYHPSSNGLAERAVQTLKEALKKTSGDIATRLARFLFQYRNTPHTTTGISPAELLLGRKPRTLLDLLHPGNSPTEPQSTEVPQDVYARVAKNQQRQKASHDKRAKQRLFHVGQSVYVKNFQGPPTWLPGVVTATRAPLTFEVNVGDGKTVRRHVDHIRSRYEGATHLKSSMPTGPSPAVSNTTESEAPRSQRGEGAPTQSGTPPRDIPSSPAPSSGRGEFGVANTDGELPIEEPAEGTERQGVEPLQLAHPNVQDLPAPCGGRSEPTEQATAQIAESQQEVRRSRRARAPPDRLGWKLSPRREKCGNLT